MPVLLVAVDPSYNKDFLLVVKYPRNGPHKNPHKEFTIIHE